MATIRGGAITDTVGLKPNDDGFCYLELATNKTVGVEDTILSYTVPTGKILYLKGGSTESDCNAVMDLYAATIQKDFGQVSHFERKAIYHFDTINGIKLIASEVVEIKATPKGDPVETVATQNFKSKIWGELKDA